MFHSTFHGTNQVKNGIHVNKELEPCPSIAGIFKAKALGRLYTVHPKQRKCFFLRLLLVNVPGPTSFEFLRTVNGRVFNTYQDASHELKLLKDDNHWDLTLADAALTSTPNSILFPQS
ncbi:unnamed protein product [Macrosiphum euphorbiae]|uniref:Uncharacterized protein n=1 Tax=Macrosiphum euphorbiae TaxID=13131 RepID=A0AAV0WVG7_9HEMI|nr:unnamed protein product [Macrosiphum euphorbiae]